MAEEEPKEAEYLRVLAYEGAERIYGTPLPTGVEERLRYELDILQFVEWRAVWAYTLVGLS